MLKLQRILQREIDTQLHLLLPYKPPLMKAEELVNLYDSYWFELQILKENPSPFNSSSSLPNPDLQIQQESPKLDLSDFPNTYTRSMSDELSSISSFKHDSFSPNSVLLEPKLRIILSEKEITEASNPSQNQFQVSSKRKKTKSRACQQRLKSKSLSELEFEELTGFMDLGFVFSEEDKDSNLALIIPGLQRLGMNDEEKEGFDNSAIPRPYLSEAWEVLNNKKKKILLGNWRIPSLSNEVRMKDSLKCWAHAVASTARRSSSDVIFNFEA